MYGWGCVVGSALRSSERQAAAATTRCAQLCVQVRGLHLLNGTERETGGGEEEVGRWCGSRARFSECADK